MNPLKKTLTVLITQILRDDYTDLPSVFNLCNLVFNLLIRDYWGFSIISK